MAKVFLICGKICCGKSTYAKYLCEKNNAVLLSVDEIMLAVFGLYTGDKHDEYTEKVQKYLFQKSVEIIKGGVNVILDWGFWSRCKRSAAREFYTVRNIECEFHYIDPDDEV
ncbi:MAG: ATP-binding protein, partial [Roseburia sp.]|nr:ATP-binding protein [Roseburia sp.]